MKERIFLTRTILELKDRDLNCLKKLLRVCGWTPPAVRRDLEEVEYCVEERASARQELRIDDAERIVRNCKQ